MKQFFSSVRARRGFTLVELMVVIVIIAAVTSLTMVVVFQSQAKADNLRCAANLKDLWAAGKAYADDWNGRLPANGMMDDPETTADESLGWMVAVAPYLYRGGDTPKVPLLDDKFRCPLDRNVSKYAQGEMVPASSDTVSYVPWTDGSDNPSNPQSPINISRGYDQANVPWLSDGEDIPATKNVATPSDFDQYVQPATIRHKGKINVLYVGGVVKMEDTPTFDIVFPNGQSKAHLKR